MLTAEQAEILRLVRNDQMDPGILPPYYSRWHSWCTVPAPRTEANCRCDVSFERPLITSRPRARSYASRERKLWWKKFKIKRFASGCDEIWDSRSIEGKDKLSTDPLTAILASLDYICRIYGASSCDSRLQSPQPSWAFPVLLLVQLKILNVDKTASKWL